MIKALLLITLITFLSFDLWGQDMVIVNAKIWTVDPDKPQAEAVAIEGNRIQAVGSRLEIEKLVTPSTQVIDAQGRLLLPGFNDSHLHFISGGQALLSLDLVGCRDVKQIQERVQQVVEKTPAGVWITGRGWDHTLFNHGQWPDKSILDAVTTEHPIFVHRIDGHVGWANSLALERAGITQDTPVPDGGDILIRDSQPTGILKETAMGLVSEIIPDPTPAQIEQALRMALKEAAKLGVTSIQDNSGIESIDLYYQLAQQSELTVRVSEWLDFKRAGNPIELSRTRAKYREKCIADKLQVGLLKGFVDGTLGSRTAYFFEPYDDDCSTNGLPQMSQAYLNKLVQSADSLGIQIGLHCIGAKANWMALTAYEKAQQKNNSGNMRHRLEHAQVLRLQDIPRLAALNVVASMQPTHCTSDLRWAEKRLGHERAKGAYAWRRILDDGGVLAFGTDWPVEPLDPMRGLYSAVTRKNIETGDPDNGWFADQGLSIKEAIYCYTMGSAYAEHQENIKGSITAGKLADLIILSKDILTVPVEEILTTQIDMTVFDGEIVYERE